LLYRPGDGRFQSWLHIVNAIRRGDLRGDRRKYAISVQAVMIANANASGRGARLREFGRAPHLGGGDIKQTATFITVLGGLFTVCG
jgi:hypothetical protein